jgi:hypothetical protein
MTILKEFLLPLLAFLTAIFLWRAFVLAFRSPKQAAYAGIIPESQLLRRDKELRFLVRRILSGQSTAIIGSFERERTAILAHLRDAEHQTKLYGEKAERLIFSLMDISMLDKQCSLAQFWEEALKPVVKIIKDTDSTLSNAYKACQDSDFDNYDLEQLIKQLGQNKWRLVLMLERIELLLHHSHLMSSRFLGGLRSLATASSNSSLAVIVTGNISLHQFQQEEIHLNIKKGSPYFNFMEEVTLGTLPEPEIDKLLAQNERDLTADERRFIKESAGGHPYLLGIAISTLQEAYENQEKESLEIAKQTFSKRIKDLLDNLLESWSQNTAQAFRLVAQKRGEVARFNSELEDLAQQGLVIQNQENGEWQVCPRIFSEVIAE